MLHKATRPHVQYGALLYQHTFDLFLILGFSLFFYVSKYYVRRNYDPPGGVLYDIHPDFASQVTNKL